MADPQAPAPDPIKDGGKFDKVITPPATSKVNIIQFTVDLDRGVISTSYQLGDNVADPNVLFKVSQQKEIAFRKAQFDALGNQISQDEFTPLYAAMKIDINGLIAALQQKPL